MQIVIDIPEQMYLNAKADILCGADILVSAIKNGTPLPKGHGRLIDADAVFENADKVLYENEYVPCVDVDDFRTAPTIIEADKESGDKE